jgi:cytochrome c-type biogenesis protein CcmH/NrfG
MNIVPLVQRTCVAVALILAAVSLSIQAQSPAATTSNLRERGVVRLKAGEFAESVNLLKQAVKSKSDDAESWYYLVVAYVQLKDFNKATSAFSTATKLQPQSVPALTGLSYALLSGRNNLRGSSFTLPQMETRLVPQSFILVSK